MPADQPVVLFDGVCNLCNASVRFLIRRDRAGRLRYASLQSQYGKGRLAALGLPPDYSDSIVFLEDGRAFTRSAAVVRLLAYLRWPWPLLGVAVVLPAPLRDALYDFIARVRYRWFGRLDECPLPRPEWRERFLG
jgi:predicted DCC family thiol-disulfide oxidoreductase YuxK